MAIVSAVEPPSRTAVPWVQGGVRMSENQQTVWATPSSGERCATAGQRIADGAVRLSREVFENPRVAIRWLLAFGVAIVALMVATVVRGDKAPIPQIWGVLIIGAMLSSAVTKLRSQTPSPAGWYDRLRMIVPSGFLVLIGAGVAVTRAGGARVAGVIIGLVSLVLLVAELRDLRLWRAQIRRLR